MKANKMIALGLISLTVLGLGAQGAKAADPEEPKGPEATSKGYVELNDNWEEGGIINPPTTGPETVEPPVVEPPVGTKELALMYWPTFDFGKADYDETIGNTLYAARFYEKGATETPANALPQFVQIRSTVQDWTLTAQAGEFINQGDSTNVLKGAQIILTNITAQQNTAEGVGNAATAGALETVESNKDGSDITGLDMSKGAVTIGTFNHADTEGVSRNSFMFGTVANAQTPATETNPGYTGVRLEIPAGLNISEDNGNYVADLTWTLSSDSI